MLGLFGQKRFIFCFLKLTIKSEKKKCSSVIVHCFVRSGKLFWLLLQTGLAVLVIAILTGTKALRMQQLSDTVHINRSIWTLKTEITIVSLFFLSILGTLHLFI